MLFFKKSRALKEFEESALPYMDSLHRFALKLTGNRHDAEDLLQDTFLKGYRSFHQYRRDTNCKAWLFTVMHNHYRDLCRKRNRGPLFSDGEDDLDFAHEVETPLPFSESGLDHRLIRKANEEAVRDGLNGIDEVYRVPVILKDIEGFSYREISHILDCPIGTVMSRLYRGRNLLKQAVLKKFEGEKTSGKIIKWKSAVK